MKQEEQQDAFANDLGRLIDRYAAEFEITYASMIGVLSLQKTKLEMAALEDE